MMEDNTILTYKLANPEKLDCFNSYLLPSNIGVEGPPIRRIRLPPAIAAYFRRLANARMWLSVYRQ
jgi:hypothetical protein